MALSNTALGQPSPTEAARLIILTHRGIAAPGRWMARTVRALAFKPSSQPVMIRYRTRLQDREARAALAHALNAAPGLVVVDAEADALLIHAIEDDDANADRAIKALETAAEAQP
jgi:multisubunit Na+/H+ antiporter MnhE subunit